MNRCLSNKTLPTPAAEIVRFRNAGPRTVRSLTAAATGRSGATLTEVLMSILVMGIGVTSLATLFPISVLKSVQAHKLTSATNLRYTAESMLNIYPTILSDPDNNGGSAPVSTAFMFDPLGRIFMDAAFQNVFGNDGTDATGTLSRWGGVFNTQGTAEYITTSPDNWVERFTGLAESTAANRLSVTLPANQPIVGITLPVATTDPQTRAILFDGLGRESQARILTGIDTATRTISWADALPQEYMEDADSDGSITGSEDVNGNGVLDSVTNVRIETQERRFTWLLTARVDSASVADVDVVVFFKRAFSTADETLHQATFDVTKSTTTVTFTGTKPNYKKGGYLFDAQFGYWYRIINISNESSTQVTLTLHYPPRATDSDGKVNVAFMQGIVDVFPLGQRAVTN